MNKRLLRNKQDFESLRDSCENLSGTVGYSRMLPRTIWKLPEPEQYPCVCAYELQYNDNGADYYEGDYIYLQDFGGLLVDPRAEAEDE